MRTGMAVITDSNSTPGLMKRQSRGLREPAYGLNVKPGQASPEDQSAPDRFMGDPPVADKPDRDGNMLDNAGRQYVIRPMTVGQRSEKPH